ncbi:uncharacterized protein TRUGW13939_03944 [Talaromyces rugulosus]|uniref:Uncharacterized protein n=1 Tax=Talaromyces rugulosus TaxID=121627 RepID=A0A7H8QS71_TALRU|nr:uncharacterized protein TRUGW13939_03944 [Talaromyces rugulosus]QKX56837.1 hypothetical protein TRUGW13939_03944 [Talaromyces rugulosus]
MNLTTLDNVSIGVVAQILPIVGIFGQDLTNNFLREAVDCFDYVIFAVGPLGIIWVLTEILKTVGPNCLKKHIQNSEQEVVNEQNIYRMIAVAAILAELGLFALFVTMKYSKFLRSEFQIFTYSFICAVAGTGSLFIGLFITAVLISHTSQQIRWKLTNECPRKAYILWLQRGLEENHEKKHDRFASYIIVKEIRSEIRQSHKEYIPSDKENAKEKPSQRKVQDQCLGIVAFVSVGAGYASQVIGVAGMHYPTQIAVFVLTILMLVVRMLSRKVSDPTHYTKTHSDHEMDWLALMRALDPEALHQTPKAPPKWAISAGQDLCKSIERVAKDLQVQGNVIEWKLPVDLKQNKRETVTFSMHKMNGKWKVDETEEHRIEFALSLWLFYIKESYNEDHTFPPTDWTVLFLGPRDIGRDLEKFWLPPDQTYFRRLRYIREQEGHHDHETQSFARGVDRNLIVGYQEDDFKSHDQKVKILVPCHWMGDLRDRSFPRHTPAVYMKSDVISLLARHIFLRFMWKCAEYVDDDKRLDLAREIQDLEKHKKKRLVYIELADYIASTGLGDLQLALMMILAPVIKAKKYVAK